MASTRKKVNGVWVDVPDRPTTVLQDIRKLNGGKLASELGTPITTTRDERFQNRYNFSWDRFYAPKYRAALDANRQAQEDGLTTVTRTGLGFTGVNVSQEYSPMAVRPGTRRSSNVFDVVRAGIAEQAADRTRHTWLYRTGKDGAIDTQDPSAMKKAMGELNSQFKDTREKLAKEWVDGFTESLEKNIDESRTQISRDISKTGESSEAATTAREAYETTRESGDVQRTREAFQNWRSAVNESDPFVGTGKMVDDGKGGLRERKVRQSTADLLKESEEVRNSAQSVLDEFNKRFGKQAAVKGGSARRSPVSGSEDRFLDELIGELEV